MRQQQNQVEQAAEPREHQEPILLTGQKWRQTRLLTACEQKSSMGNKASARDANEESSRRCGRSAKHLKDLTSEGREITQEEAVNVNF